MYVRLETKIIQLLEAKMGPCYKHFMFSIALLKWSFAQ